MTKIKEDFSIKVEASVIHYPPYFGNNDIGADIAAATIIFARSLPVGTDIDEIPQRILDSKLFDFDSWGEKMYMTSVPVRNVPKMESISRNVYMLKKWVLTTLGNNITVTTNENH